jgi:hypothetical protein
VVAETIIGQVVVAVQATVAVSAATEAWVEAAAVHPMESEIQMD